MRIPIGITAKDEAANLPRVLRSIKDSIVFAEANSQMKFDLWVILNDTTDDSIRRLEGEQVLITKGGLVEAQREFADAHRSAPFILFSDADIVVDERAVYEVARSLQSTETVKIAYAEKVPLKNKTDSTLARALYLYNLNNGYQSQRFYFNGQFFGIKNWRVPYANELNWQPAANNRFLNLEAGIRCDDIYLSRQALAEFGPDAIKLVDASIYYRPPETFRGMFRKYQRMTLEIERMRHYFPENENVHKTWGQRRFVPNELSSRSVGEKFYYSIFVSALYLCKALYRIQRFYYSKFALNNCPTWLPVTETKREIA